MKLVSLLKPGFWDHIWQVLLIIKRLNFFAEKLLHHTKFQYHGPFLLFTFNGQNCQRFKRYPTQVRREDLFWETEPFRNDSGGQLVTSFESVF